MLTLLTFPASLGEPSLSPFCTKAMCLLQMAGLDWKPELTFDLAAMPLGKLPVLKTDDGLIPDSNLMADWLEAQGVDLYPGRDAEGRAKAHLALRLAEEHLRLRLVHDRWVDEAGWQAFMPIVFAEVPEGKREAVAQGARDAVRAGLHWQGIARFSDADRQAYLAADLTALSALVGGHTFLFGETPCLADASVLAILSGIDHLPADTRLRRALRADGRLMDYIERGRAALYTPLMQPA